MIHRGAAYRSSPSWRTRFILLVILLAFGLRAGSLTAQSLWRDEVDALCYAFEFPHLIARALFPEEVRGLTTPCACPPSPLSPVETESPGSSLLRLGRTLAPMIRQNGPVYFLLLRGWIALMGYTEYAVRFFSVWFGVLGVPLIYVLGRRLLGSAAGSLAAILVAASPYLVWYGQEAKMYTLVPALVLLAVYALRRGAEGGRKHWWAVQVVATSLAFYTHIWSALLVPVHVLLLWSWWPLWRRHWLGALVSLALLTLPYLPLALWQVPSAFQSRETGFPDRSLGEMALILLNGWSAGITGWGLPWGAAACGGAAVLGLGGTRISPDAAPSTRGKLSALGLMGWLAMPLASVWFISRWQPLFTDRYLIWVAPPFYLLVARGLASLWRWVRWLALPFLVAISAVILVVFGGNLWTQAGTPLKSDLRAAATYVEETFRPGDLLVFQIPHIRYTFDYYFGPQRYVWADGLYTNHRGADGAYLTAEEVVGQRMAQTTWGHQTVWLVASEVPMWDDRNLVQGWLDDNGERATEAHFVYVDVYRYRLEAP